jgi:hypothetical protein
MNSHLWPLCSEIGEGRSLITVYSLAFKEVKMVTVDRNIVNCILRVCRGLVINMNKKSSVDYHMLKTLNWTLVVMVLTGLWFVEVSVKALK